MIASKNLAADTTCGLSSALMNPKSPNPIDLTVGSRIRTRRLLVGMSQEKLAEVLEVTFQQVQKYEKGTNRVSASRLHRIAGALGVDVQYFFSGHPDGGRPSEAGAFIDTFLADRDGVELAKAFITVSDPTMRRAIVELVRAAGVRPATAA
jgi:transcriptional regulator with XRE-family HTH domain